MCAAPTGASASGPRRPRRSTPRELLAPWSALDAAAPSAATSAPTARFQSPRGADCRIVLVRAGALGTPRFRRSRLERDARPATGSCPKCLCRLQKLTLADDARWVEVEECDDCGLLVLDEGELDTLAALVAADAPEWALLDQQIRAARERDG